MNKIVCDVCGTDYPETAAQCPICGCANAGNQTAAGADSPEAEEKAAYTPVKGGRYSKSNVRKRLKANQIPYDPIPDPEPDPEPEYEDDEQQFQEEDVEEEEQGSNRGLIIVVVILMLAIVAVASYIAISILGLGFDKLPSVGTQTGTSQTAPTTQPTESSTEPVTVPCTKLELSDVDIFLRSAGSVWQLTATPEPADTTDKVVFTSSDENVVTVDAAGLVTAVASGEASITVTCGDITVDCPVLCEFAPVTEPTETPEGFVLKLQSKDFTLKKAGATYVLYKGLVDPADITWTTDNAEVATIEKGVVTAVGNGRTRVYGQYGDQKVSCWVSCKLPENTATEPADPDTTTDPEDVDATAYKLLVNGNISIYGDEHNAEVTITVGEEFRLTVEDDQGVRQNVDWEASKKGICSVEGRTVTGEKAGKVTLTATIGDQTFKCVIIVK